MSETPKNPLRWMALVILDRAELPQFEDVAQAVGEYFSEAPVMTAAGATEKLLTCSIGEYTAAATLVDKPVPWSQLEGPCATAWYWPDAAEKLRGHEAHLLVTLIDEGGSAVEKSTCLTQWVAGLVASTPTLGVFWGPSRMVHPARAFIEQAVQLSPTDLPLFLWIDFRIEQLDNGNSRLYTTGLEALGFSELEVHEFAGDPQHLLEFAYNIAHYQIGKNKVINDGDTIGLTEEVQVTARREPSILDEKIEVIKLEIEVAKE